MAWGDELRRSLETSEGLDDREIATKVGLPAVLAEWLRETTRAAMAKETVPTVSEFVQVYTVGPSGIGWAEAEAKPPIARTCAEFVELAKRETFSTAEAVAVPGFGSHSRS